MEIEYVLVHYNFDFDDEKPQHKTEFLLNKYELKNELIKIADKRNLDVSSKADLIELNDITDVYRLAGRVKVDDMGEQLIEFKKGE